MAELSRIRGADTEEQLLERARDHAAKVAELAENLPSLEKIVVFDVAGGAADAKVAQGGSETELPVAAEA